MGALDKQSQIDDEKAVERRKKAAKAARLGLRFPYKIIPPDWSWIEPPANPKPLPVRDDES